MTGSEITVLGTSTKLYTAYYYDVKGQVIKTVQSNLLNGYEVTTTSYTFTGQPQTVTHTHSASGKSSVTETYTYTYDAEDRLTQVQHKLGSAQVTLAAYTYDNLGRIQTRKLHGSATNQLTYSYNVRDWLTGITGTKFNQNLYYNTGSGTACYNGNISSMTWEAGNETTQRGYKFAYDGLNRLTSATYGEGTGISSNANRFTEKVTSYDKNGNIKGLQRYGQTSASAYGLIDNLTYTLDGNRPTRVDDAVSASAYNNGFEFKDGVKQANEYTYDANGNLTKDLNRNITEIQYNFLNLPSKVTFSDGSTIEYTYAADGTKLRTVHTINGTTTTTDYCGDVIYENGVRKYLLTDEGYVALNESNKYYYYLKDHQGNNRVVVASDGTVKETNHYYPFGGLFASSSNVQPYKYNGKEYDDAKGLNWYDYGARMYDPALGRFTTQDPLAEKSHPVGLYGYCLNNPVRFTDPTGCLTSPIYDREGNLLGTDDRGLQGKAIIMNEDNFKQGMSHEDALNYSLGYEGLANDEARSKFETSFKSLPSRPDYDGELTLSEANKWYREGNGSPLFVDISKIDLSPVAINDLELNKTKYFNYAGLLYPNMETGLIYGTLGIILLDNMGHVRIGNLNGRIDRYDFDYQSGRHFRNFATKIGNTLAGQGIGYDIFGYGVGNVKRRSLFIPF